MPHIALLGLAPEMGGVNRNFRVLNLSLPLFVNSRTLRKVIVTSKILQELDLCPSPMSVSSCLFHISGALCSNWNFELSSVPAVFIDMCLFSSCILCIDCFDVIVYVATHTHTGVQKTMRACTCLFALSRFSYRNT